MIVKVVLHSALEPAQTKQEHDEVLALGDQVTWISDVLQAQIVEEVEAVPVEGSDSFFRRTHYFGQVAERVDYEAQVQRALQQGNVLPLPNIRYRIVWLWIEGGTGDIVDQLVLGDLCEAYLMSDDGKTIDRLR